MNHHCIAVPNETLLKHPKVLTGYASNHLPYGHAPNHDRVSFLEDEDLPYGLENQVPVN